MDPSISVAVIEAGGFYEQDNGNYSVLPGLWASSPFLAATEVFPQNPLMDWGLVSVPQTGALNRRIHYAQGKTLSGSSALNAMAYHRGTTGAYDRWADLVDDQSYTFKALLPYFEKSCNFSPPDDAKRQTPNATVRYDSSVFSPTGGPLQVSYSNWVDVALTWFQRAFTNIGLPISEVGFNSGSLAGKAAWTTSTIDPNLGERSSSQTSFLEEAIQNTNIIVYTQARASKILFKGNTASGVSVTTQGVNYTISANKEVILSAGVFHSPQLLMISGRLFAPHQQIKSRELIFICLQVSDPALHSKDSRSPSSPISPAWAKTSGINSSSASAPKSTSPSKPSSSPNPPPFAGSSPPPPAPSAPSTA